MDKNKISQDVMKFNQEFIEMMQRDAGIPDVITIKYTMQSLIFKSKRSEVYLITDKNNKKYVLKIYDLQENTADNNVIASLNHPNIPKYISKYIFDERVYFIREYCEGITLTKYIEENGVMSSKQIIKYIKSLLDILHYLHDREIPIIYRDIKGENIIISGDEVKLIDFDIARQYNQKASKDTVYYGTKQFSAPEQFGYQQTDARTDIYSVGVLMLYMATMSTNLSRISNMDNREFAEIIKKCTAFSPDERYNNVTELEGALTIYEKFKFSSPKKTKKIIIITSSVLLVCAVLFYSFYFSGENKADAEKNMSVEQTDNVIALATTATTSTPEPTPEKKVFAKNEIAVFQSELIEQAVREQLLKDDEEDIYIFELDKITYLNIYGDKYFDNSHQIFMSDLRYSYPNYYVSFDINDNEKVYVSKGTITTLDDLLMFDNIEHLSLVYQKIADLSPISHLPLTHLNVISNFVVDISPAVECEFLESIEFDGNPVEDISPLSDAKYLSVVSGNDTYVSDLSPLSDLSYLEFIYMGNTKVTDLTPICNMHLINLFLEDNDIDDFTCLTDVENLIINDDQR